MAMPSHKKVALKSIKALTFHQDEKTLYRRTSAIPQLTCVGKPCQYFQPEVVQCTNMGDDGLGNVQWRCDTDLPSSLRLGKVEVSCEGWNAPGDKNVLQGSCGLTYDLHQTNPQMFDNAPHFRGKGSTLERYIDLAFYAVFYLVLAVLLYSIIRSILLRLFPRFAPPPASSWFPWDWPDHGHGGHGGHGPGGGGGGGGGGGPGFNPGPPPPYTKDETFPSTDESRTDTRARTGRGGINVNFWTGLAAGGAAGYLAANARAGQAGTRGNYVDAQDARRRMGARRFDEDDRGVGPSDLGEMRRATGFGGSSTR